MEVDKHILHEFEESTLKVFEGREDAMTQLDDRVLSVQTKPGPTALGTYLYARGMKELAKMVIDRLENTDGLQERRRTPNLECLISSYIGNRSRKTPTLVVVG